MNKTAIVLAGGGSRGAYQIGVWKALREMGIDYQLVTGTSVGALNGVLMVQQKSTTRHWLCGKIFPHSRCWGICWKEKRIWTTADCARRLQRKH